MTLENNTSPDTTTPPILRWTVAQGDSFGLRVGDVLAWDPRRPKAERVTLTRVTGQNCGALDKLMLRGHIVPIGVSLFEARRALLRQVVTEQRARDEEDAAA